MEPRSAEAIAAHAMKMVLDGKVRNHKLDNTSSNHGLEAMNRERQLYRDFVPTKLARLLYELPEGLQA